MKRPDTNEWTSGRAEDENATGAVWPVITDKSTASWDIADCLLDCGTAPTNQATTTTLHYITLRAI